MKSAEAWKIRRELKRVFRQLWNIPVRCGSYLFSSKYYDLFLARKIIQTTGSVQMAKKVVIYLIYPNFGLQQSHIDALKYLGSRGYAPFVISNLYLNASDRNQLLPFCHMCIERPNFGYDFGGYRDGILTVAAHLSNLDNLLLINDSTWFPLPGSSDWLKESEALRVDLAAAASNYGIPRVDSAQYKTIEWKYVTTHKNFHYCSFALLFSHRVLTHPGFIRFWRKYPLSNSKDRTVRRGEIGMSQWILSKGFTHGAPYDVATLQSDLEALDDVRLREVAENVMVPEDQHLLCVKQDALAGNPSRQDLICLVLTCVARQGSSYALADFAVNERGFTFLKKSPVWLSREASDITLRLANDLPGDQGAHILAEVKMLRAEKARFEDSSRSNEI